MFRRLTPLVLGLLMVATTLSSVAAQPFTPHSSVAPASDDLRTIETEHIREFSRLPIGKGSELIFYVMLGTPEEENEPGKDAPRDGVAAIGSDPTLGGRIHGVGVSQYIPAGGMDPATVRELQDANPHELFHAYSERGREIPAILREYGKNRFARQAQGWALDLVKPNVYNIFSCVNSEQSVVNAIGATGLPYSYNELSKGPHNWGLWFLEDPNALFPTYFAVNGLATVGDAYFHVMLCKEDPLFLNTSVNVRLSYQESDDGVVLSEGELHWQLHDIGDQMSFMSWPFDSDLSGDNVWFWLLNTGNVHFNDTLHIGTAWS